MNKSPTPAPSGAERPTGKADDETTRHCCRPCSREDGITNFSLGACKFGNALMRFHSPCTVG